jgi:DNA replication protein DnaC
MNNYQELNKNLKDLKLYQISIKLSEYIEKINENKIGVAEALLELTNQELEVKNYNATHAMVKVAGFPHLKEVKDFDFNFQPKINKQQFLDFESLRFIENNNNILLIGNSGHR